MESEAIVSPEPERAARSTFRWVFLGGDGMRAGWSLLLFGLLVYGLGRVVTPAVRHLHLVSREGARAREITPGVSFWGDAIRFGLFALAALVMSWVERRRFAAYGLRGRRILADFGAGLLTGLGLLSALVGALYGAHALVFDGEALRGSMALEYAGRWAGAFLFVGLFEEFATRGYVQFTVARGVAGMVRAARPEFRQAGAVGFWVAAFLLSVCLFMFGHVGNAGETAWGILAVGVAGVVFAYSLWWTGSLWWAVGMHTAWDWAETCLYGTADSGLRAVGHVLATHAAGPAWLSGGSTGPEGSVLVLPTLLLAAVVVRVTMPERRSDPRGAEGGMRDKPSGTLPQS